GRWLDLATILVPLASLLPTVTTALRSSPILRLARIGRIVSLGVRASGWSNRHRSRHAQETTTRGPAQVTFVSDPAEFAPEPSSLAAVLRWLGRPDAQWFHVSNPSPDELKQIAAATKL